MNNNLTSSAIAYIKVLFKENSDGHDFDHSMRVYHNAMIIAECEQPCDMEVVALASLLHDVDDHKLFNTKDNSNARSFLKRNNIDKSRADIICQAINEVSFSKNKGKTPSTIEAKIVQDADRLDALGAIGIARTFAYGGKHGRSLDDSIKHFHDKLLLLKDMMNTDTGKKLAYERHDFLTLFLNQYKNEIKYTNEI